MGSGPIPLASWVSLGELPDMHTWSLTIDAGTRARRALSHLEDLTGVPQSSMVSIYFAQSKRHLASGRPGYGLLGIRKFLSRVC